MRILRSRHQSTRRALLGFTLIEVMIAVAVVAIATAFAVPNYSEYRRRAWRTDAQLVLLQATAYMERRYAECNSFTKVNPTTDPPCTEDLADLPTALKRSPADSGTTKRYTITLTRTGSQAYSLSAAPVITDTACGTLSIDSTGQRGETGSQTFDYCWRR
ncbi:MAG: hypothetical protein RJA99_432 [Pseudomonadota bacterium]|jgi:type IV pilus assembly protein PilE